MGKSLEAEEIYTWRRIMKQSSIVTIRNEETLGKVGMTGRLWNTSLEISSAERKEQNRNIVS